MEEEKKIITLSDLYDDTNAIMLQDQLLALLDNPPKPSWIVKHKFIKDYYYLPIGIVEYLLKKVFKAYSIQITAQGTAFNGVYVVVRVNYRDPITGQMKFHDGIGGCELQTAKGKSAADMANINPGALSMAFPIAKTVAIKDACDHFGKLFGSDLNRKDTLTYVADEVLVTKEEERIVRLIEAAKTPMDLANLRKDAEKFGVNVKSAYFEKLNSYEANI